jgi:hypothetical protein
MGYDGFSYTGYSPDSEITVNDTSVIADVNGDQDAPISKLITNPGKRMTLPLRVASGTFTPPIKGAVISLTAPGAVSSTKWFVEDVSVRYAPGICLMTLTVSREDSMAATYDT